MGCRLWGRTESDMTDATQQHHREQQAVGKLSFGGKPIGGKCEIRWSSGSEDFPLSEPSAFPLIQKKLPKKAKWLSQEALQIAKKQKAKE